MMGLD